MIIWALFDSGNGCYKQAVDKYFPDVEIHSIGIDAHGSNSHFINLDLADYSELFTGKSKIFETLDKLPCPDVILASPPCECWSTASGLLGGNNSWQYRQKINTLLGNIDTPPLFALQTKANFDKGIEKRGGYFVASWSNSIYKRINGELCAYNTLRIIEHYKPKVWVVENPQGGSLWNYYKQIHSFTGVKNVAHYSAYDEGFSKKPTIFLSNIFLDLKTTQEKAKNLITTPKGGRGDRKVIYGYNKRSNIPLLLIKHIIEMCRKEIGKS